MTIEELIQRKQENGYSLKKISECSGVPVVTLQKIFAGKTEHPRRNTLNAIEKVFLLSDDAEKEKKKPYNRNKKNENRENTSFAYGFEGEKTYSSETNPVLLTARSGEWIDGIFYEMPASDIVHQDITAYIHMCFYLYCGEKKRYKVFGPGLRVKTDSDDCTIMIPDLCLVSDYTKLHRDGIYGAPDFILEVLSRETRKKDMSVKLQKYMNSGVREYWMIDPDQEKLVAYNFMEEDFLPYIYSLEGKVAVAMTGGELEIDLRPVKEKIQDFQKLDE